MGGREGINGPDDMRPSGDHWEGVYRRIPAESTSWFQVRPTLSLAMIEAAGVGPEDAIIDVGGGASTLTQTLAAAGYRDLTVVDVSATALRLNRERLAHPAPGLHWIESDILDFDPPRHYDLWHDRALFHFMTGPRQRDAYRAVLERALAPGGHAIIATFALDGPERCSGLPVRRYDGARLLDVLGDTFDIVSERHETHLTPAGKDQSFAWFLLRRV